MIIYSLIKTFISNFFKVEKELNDICMDILEVLSDHLIPSAQNGESKVFYNKM